MTFKQFFLPCYYLPCYKRWLDIVTSTSVFCRSWRSVYCEFLCSVGSFPYVQCFHKHCGRFLRWTFRFFLKDPLCFIELDVYLIYLKGNGVGWRGREVLIDLLVYFLNAYNKQCWAKLKSGAGHSIWISHRSGRVSCTCAISCCLPVCSRCNAGLGSGARAQTQTCPNGMWSSQEVALLLCQRPVLSSPVNGIWLGQGLTASCLQDRICDAGLLWATCILSPGILLALPIRPRVVQWFSKRQLCQKFISVLKDFSPKRSHAGRVHS